MMDTNHARARVFTSRAGLFSLLFMLLCSSCSNSSNLPGSALTDNQHAAISSAIELMDSSGLARFAGLARQIDRAGEWRAALPNDQYLAASEKSGDTPFAYTLPDPSHPYQPIAIVLAPRFFTDADERAQAALMVHEMGHWLAFLKKGKSTEYDGYKTEFDNHKALGLTSDDGLTYYAMLDGVEQNVVPIDKSYAKQSEIVAYNNQ
jgi:hypothetical protein